MVKDTFLEYNGTVLDAIYCRLCGQQIAKRGPSKMVRGASYGELKLAFSDGSFHVTHSCKNCIQRGIPVEELQAMYEMEYPETERKVVNIVATDFECKGIA